MKLCRIDGCINTNVSNGSTVCNQHKYKREVTGTYDNMLAWYAERTAQRAANKINGLPVGQFMDKEGYVRTYDSGKQVYYHRWVMEQQLGRLLTSDESVHHKDGDRTNNELSNLELWSKYQPTGQRVADKVEYALNILRLYAKDLLAE